MTELEVTLGPSDFKTQALGVKRMLSPHSKSLVITVTVYSIWYFPQTFSDLRVNPGWWYYHPLCAAEIHEIVKGRISALTWLVRGQM